MHINELLKAAVTSGWSDLHLKVGSYPISNVAEFKLKVQGISTTTGMARDEMAKRPAIGGGGAPEITRFGG